MNDFNKGMWTMWLLLVILSVVILPILKASGVIKGSGEIICEKYFTGSTYSDDINDCVIPVK